MHLDVDRYDYVFNDRELLEITDLVIQSVKNKRSPLYHFVKKSIANQINYSIGAESYVFGIDD
tara:strand:- start:12774 stop:12962 length:189 start_codon:yes stop_codon:yes gene_type:complete